MIAQLLREVSKAVVGQQAFMKRLIVALLARGHVLIEGVPGIAKTLAANSLAKSMGVQFKRIQFTPDLLPSDLLGTAIFDAKESAFRIERGPLFSNIVLADEINRAPPKVQSALLEVMQEKQITIFGKTFILEPPFFVLATQNPIEQEGTYPLPEAECDRFIMKVLTTYPTNNEEFEILNRYAQKTEKDEKSEIQSVLTRDDILKLQNEVEKVFIEDKVKKYIVDLVVSTRMSATMPAKIQGLERWVQLGASPRATLALAKVAQAEAYLAGRAYVTPDDVRLYLADVLRHRIMLTYEAEAEGVTADALTATIIKSVPCP